MLDTFDPHLYFFRSGNPLRFNEEDYTGKYYGLGIQIQKQEDRLVVIAPIEGTCLAARDTARRCRHPH